MRISWGCEELKPFCDEINERIKEITKLWNKLKLNIVLRNEQVKDRQNLEESGFQLKARFAGKNHKYSKIGLDPKPFLRVCPC